MNDLYFCPTSGEVESATDGGFDTCCAHPELHLPMPDTEATRAVSEALSDGLRRKYVTVTPVEGHTYLSTGCHHGDLILPDGRTGHEYCQAMTGYQGEKRPGRCKHCGAECSCPCHAPTSVATAATPEPAP